MKMADCCIVLCNRECVDPSEEDAENIMRYMYEYYKYVCLPRRLDGKKMKLFII